MGGDLLGEVRDDGRLIALRAETTDAQLRCTLAHELVHLERGQIKPAPEFNKAVSAGFITGIGVLALPVATLRIAGSIPVIKNLLAARES